MPEIRRDGVLIVADLDDWSWQRGDTFLVPRPGFWWRFEVVTCGPKQVRVKRRRVVNRGTIFELPRDRKLDWNQRRFYHDHFRAFLAGLPCPLTERPWEPGMDRPTPKPDLKVPPRPQRPDPASG